MGHLNPAVAVTCVVAVCLFCRQGLDFVKQLIAMLRKHCQSSAPSLLGEFDAIVDAEDQHIGFIVNERIINLPPQISPPSFDALR